MTSCTPAPSPAHGDIQRLAFGMARHRHGRGYAALVLEGGYIERGGSGRWRLSCGDVVYHRAFEAHDDVSVEPGTRILNLDVDLPLAQPTVFNVDHSDDLRRLRADDVEGLREVLGSAFARPPLHDDWYDKLAIDLQNAPIRISAWSERLGLSREHVSRGFARAFGVTPAAFRIEAQVQRALGLLGASRLSLADIAVTAGFSDQAHLSRAVRAISGRTPGYWRKINSVQDREVCEA